MKAAVLHEFGRMLVVEECGEPEAGDGERVLDVAAGTISVEVEEVPLDNAAEAWGRHAASPHRKLVVVP